MTAYHRAFVTAMILWCAAAFLHLYLESGRADPTHRFCNRVRFPLENITVISMKSTARNVFCVQSQKRQKNSTFAARYVLYL